MWLGGKQNKMAGCWNHKGAALYTILFIIGSVIIILRIPSISSISEAFILSVILIGAFILSLIFTDYRTHKSKIERDNQMEELKVQIDNLIVKISNLLKKETITPKDKEQLTKYENELKEIKEALLPYLEPIGVLDKHEIRRSLTISITITYFLLLSMSIFGIGKLKPNSPMIDLFTTVFLVMIAFYFGSRAVEDGIKLFNATKSGNGE